jgi:hypothetical protein
MSQDIRSLYDEVKELRKHIRNLEAMTKKITHCPDCGSTWYDDGFTAECPQCRVRRLEEENHNHKQTLAGIAAMNPTEEGDRAIQWAKDGLSGYTMSADATVKYLQDRVRGLENTLERVRAERDTAQEVCDAELTEAQEEAARLNRIIREADTNRAHLDSPVVYGNFDLELNYIPPPELPNIPAITREQDRLRDEVRRLEAELEEWQGKTMKARMEAAEFEVALDKAREAKSRATDGAREGAHWQGLYWKEKAAKDNLVRRVEEVAEAAEENMSQELYYPGWIQWKEHVKRLRNIVKEG